MASARGDALDWAVALGRAPGERHALRQRPLPDGMDVVLQVAGGSHAAAIEEAAAHAGMAPAEVVEAARFYLREMLFFPEADAYRVLGLAADASDEQVKHHHRLLQQWLHPDRPTSDWDAAFAARVNAAWSQLRTRARREAYAAMLPATSAASDATPSWSPPTRTPAPRRDAGHAEPALDHDRWRRRAPVLALFGVCAVLGVLAVRDMQREPEPALAQVAIKQETADVAPVALQLPDATQASAEKPTPPQRRAAAKPAEKQVAVAPKPAPPVRKVIAAKPVAKPAPVAIAAKPVAKPMVAAATPKPVPKLVAITAAPKPAPKHVAIAAAPRPVAKPVAVAAAPKPAPAPTQPAAKPVAATPIRKPAPIAVAPAKPSTVTVPAAPKPATRPAPVATAASALVPRVTTPVASKPIAVMPPPKPVPPPATPAAVVAATPLAAAAATKAPEASSPQLVAQAQQTGQRLLAYVSGRGGGVPPIWANVASQTQASRAREALQGAGRVTVGTSNWRVGDNSAAMQASLTPRDGSARRLRVDMVWREQRWLVTGLVLEQAQ